MVKRYSLSLSRTYVSNWGTPEAIRELLQNALDSSSEFEFELAENCIAVFSRNSALSPESLVLGNTSKAGISTKIGSFGEGYKLALLVLTRLGKEVSVYNDGLLWKPVFKYNKDFGCETLYIEERTYDPSKYPGPGLTFIVKGLTKEENAKIVSGCLHMQEKVPEDQIIYTKYGEILLDREGIIYVNGLYVCTIPKMKYSYNLRPQYIRLERDRQTVSSFDIQWLLKDVWLDSGREDLLWEMVEQEAPDSEYVGHAVDAERANAYYEQFYLKNPKAKSGAVAAAGPSDIEQKSKQYASVVPVSSTALSILKSSPAYISSLPAPVEIPSPAAWIKKWSDDLACYWFSGGPVPDHLQKEFDALLKQAENWTNNA